MEPFRYDVFLSFSSQNEALARPLWERLSQCGLRVFWSDALLKKKVGDSWYGVIQDALVSSKHFILLWSPEAEQSRFVKIEYETFDGKFAHPPARKLAPVLLPGTSPDSMPLLLQRLQHFSLTNDEDLGHLIESLGGRYEPLAQENARLRQRVDALEALLKKKGAEDVAAARREITALKKELRAEKKQRTSLEKEVASITKERAAARAQVEELERQLQAANAPAVKSTSLPETRTDELGIEYVLIRPGSFMMGSENGRDNEKSRTPR